MINVAETRRKELELSQNEIATRANISRQYYNEIENGKRTPSVDVAKAVSEVLGISWTIFFENEVNT